MTTTARKFQRARDLFAELDREHPEPVRGLPGTLTIFHTAEGRDFRVEAWFESHGHREGPRRFVVSRPAGGVYVVEVDGHPIDRSGWVGRVEGADGVRIGEPFAIRRLREGAERAAGRPIPPVLFALGLGLAAWAVFR